MLTCAAIIGLVDSCIVVWFGAHTSIGARAIAHREFVELQISVGDLITDDLANFISITLAIIGRAMMKREEKDEKITSIS